MLMMDSMVPEMNAWLGKLLRRFLKSTESSVSLMNWGQSQMTEHNDQERIVCWRPGISFDRALYQRKIGRIEIFPKAFSRDIDRNFDFAVHLGRNFCHHAEMQALFMAGLEVWSDRIDWFPRVRNDSSQGLCEALGQQATTRRSKFTNTLINVAPCLLLLCREIR